MATLLSCLSDPNKPIVKDHLVLTPLGDTQRLISYRQVPPRNRNATLEREANHCVVDLKTKSFLCRPFDGGDVLTSPECQVTEARVLRTGVYIFLYAENGGWSYISPTLSKEECRRIIEGTKVVFPKNISFTYCFEVRGNEEFIYGSSSQNAPTKMYLFAVRNNKNGAYVALNSSALFENVLLCENIPVRPGVSAATAGMANTGSWGVYVQYGNNLIGAVVSPNKLKTKLFSMGNEHHMMYRILSAVRTTPVVITDSDYNETQRKLYAKLVTIVKRLTDYHQAKLDAIPEDAAEETLLSENANDRYVVDMWAISKHTGVKVKPMVYYSTLYPIFAPQFDSNGRVAWVNKILMDFLEDELEAPEVKPWIPLSQNERSIAEEKNYTALVTPQHAPHAVVPHAVAPHAVAQHAVAQHTVAPHAVAPHAVAPHAVAPHAVAPHAVAPHAVAPHAVAPPNSAQQRNAARLAAANAARLAMQSPAPAVAAAPATATTASFVADHEADKRPDTNVKQDQYLAQTVTASGRSRASLVVKQPSRL